MKKIISNEEIIKKAKKWLASFSNDELSKKLEKEIYLYELNKVRNLEWFSKVRDIRITNVLPIECKVITSKDKRTFDWTFSDMPINDKIPYIPNSYIEYYFDLEAAA